MLTGNEIRRKFLDFFIQKGHREVHSSSLVPANDPTLLFTNAGMNQFKDVFLGLEKRDYARATSSQKCVRAGGKHNDLENVGFTNRHHTFFEMLGNFSFGDYFKKEAIAYAWELITSPQWFGIDKSKLYVTIFKGENGVPRDAEAYDLWLGQGVPKDRIFEFGAKDNFWQMGDTGPCGPCSEIHYDMGLAASDQGHADCAFSCDCGRYVELWNLVFMQFDRDASGKLNPLPKPSIDTGAGLERMAAVLQCVISNYETDLFTPLIKRAAELTGTSLKKELDKEAHTKSAASLRVIADHSRAATFLISDGVTPSNEGRGYVLRKIMRRAMIHGRMLGARSPFLYRMVETVRDQMRDAYPELVETTQHVGNVVQAEERQFARTLEQGLEEWDNLLRGKIDDHLLSELDEEKPASARVFTEALGLSIKRKDPSVLFEAVERELGPSRAQRFREQCNSSEGPSVRIDGEEAFRLWDTFGLSIDFMRDMARDQGHDLDIAGFDRAMQEQRERARASWKGIAKSRPSPLIQELIEKEGATFKGYEFEGYERTRSNGCEVIGIDRSASQGDDSPGSIVAIILDRTPFYAESGGQVGDTGWFFEPGTSTVVADVLGCYFAAPGVRAHKIRLKRTLQRGDRVDAVVNAEIRESTMRNHTATHLLQAGLREVLGKHVKQAGSLVAPNHLRFDFSHFTGVAEEELQDIEDIINKEVLRNERVEVIENVPIDVAINEYHAMALFGEKYGDRVRVIKIGDFSTELCGGTHTGATGEIGLIKILKEGSVSSGVRRIEAVTGEGSLRHFRKDHELEEVVAALTTHSETTSPAEALKQELEKKEAEIKRLSRELDQARMKSASSSTANIGEKVREVHGVKVLTHRVDNLDRAQMRTLVDQMRDKLGSAVVVLGSASNGNVSLIVGVTKDLTGRIQAGKVIGPVAQKVGGKGGGRPDLAEAGGKDAAALDSALGEAYGVVESLLS
ncbi:MAG: alanine--tRNA ligase [Terriglobales bacterium]